jgi:hypothetical protein
MAENPARTKRKPSTLDTCAKTLFGNNSKLSEPTPIAARIHRVMITTSTIVLMLMNRINDYSEIEQID